MIQQQGRKEEGKERCGVQLNYICSRGPTRRRSVSFSILKLALADFSLLLIHDCPKMSLSNILLDWSKRASESSINCQLYVLATTPILTVATCYIDLETTKRGGRGGGDTVNIFLYLLSAAKRASEKSAFFLSGRSSFVERIIFISPFFFCHRKQNQSFNCLLCSVSK